MAGKNVHFTGNVAVVQLRDETYLYPLEDCPNQYEAEVFLGPDAKHLGYMKSARIYRWELGAGYLDCSEWELVGSMRKIHSLQED